MSKDFYSSVVADLSDDLLPSWHVETKRLRDRFADSEILRPEFDRMIEIERAELYRRQAAEATRREGGGT